MYSDKKIINYHITFKLYIITVLIREDFNIQLLIKTSFYKNKIKINKCNTYNKNNNKIISV